jgi:hypothetical protein
MYLNEISPYADRCVCILRARSKNADKSLCAHHPVKGTERVAVRLQSRSGRHAKKKGRIDMRPFRNQIKKT